MNSHARTINLQLLRREQQEPGPEIGEARVGPGGEAHVHIAAITDLQCAQYSCPYIWLELTRTDKYVIPCSATHGAVGHGGQWCGPIR